MRLEQILHPARAVRQEAGRGLRDVALGLRLGRLATGPTLRLAGLGAFLGRRADDLRGTRADFDLLALDPAIPASPTACAPRALALELVLQALPQAALAAY